MSDEEWIQTVTFVDVRGRPLPLENNQPVVRLRRDRSNTTRGKYHTYRPRYIRLFSEKLSRLMDRSSVLAVNVMRPSGELVVSDLPCYSDAAGQKHVLCIKADQLTPDLSAPASDTALQVAVFVNHTLRATCDFVLRWWVRRWKPRPRKRAPARRQRVPWQVPAEPRLRVGSHGPAPSVETSAAERVDPGAVPTPVGPGDFFAVDPLAFVPQWLPPCDDW